MKKNNKNKKNLLLVFAILFATVVTGTLVSTTYAKYTSSLGSKESSATVAKWAFDTDNASTALTFALDKTYDASTLVEGKIAPGTSGSFTISLSNANSEVGVNYSIELAKSNLPTNVKLYSDADHTNELTNNTLTGTLAPKASAKEIKIYWAWAYDSNDDATDTADGSAAKTATITATVTGTQVTPAEKQQ